MPFHWCNQETEALLILLSTIPFIGLFFKRLHVRFHAKWKTICGNKCHKDSCHMPSHIPHGKTGEGQCQQHEDTCNHGKTIHETCGDCTNSGWPDNDELNEIGYKLTTRGLVAGTILNHGPMTHEQMVALHPNEDPDAIHTAINELVEEGRLILDGDLLTEGDLFG